MLLDVLGNELAATLPRALLGVAAFRLLPFALWACLGARLRPGPRALVALGYGALAAVYVAGSSASSAVLSGAALGLLYFVVVGSVVHAMPPLRRADRIDRPSLLLCLLVGDLLLPALIFRGDMLLPVLVMGFEQVFAAYSYIEDCAARPGRRSSLRRALFFLLVDPTLVYREAGARQVPAGIRIQPLLRVMLGLAALGLAQLLAFAQPWVSLGGLGTPSGAPATGDYAAFLVHHWLLFMGLYASHSGVASIQIGTMGLLGYRVPERYRHPWLASGPVDFWRRWNRYLGRWLELYVFRPVLRGARSRGTRAPLAAALATAVAFAFNGLVHESLLLALGNRQPGLALLGFVLQAVPVWMVLALGRRTASRLRGRPWLRRCGAVLGWAAFANVALVTASILLPALS